jgi:hypothetical protein
MARLEDITVGANVVGIAGNVLVTVVAVKWYGNAVLEVTFKDSRGQLASQLLYREDEDRLDVKSDSLPWSFDADANLLRLASEAYRINLAHIFDPYLAVHTSAIEPLPHQISAVYQEMLSRLPLRYILADDPGAGKTIMTGLFLKELLVRGDLKRCMIVSPGNLAEQWQDELYRKFNLRFEILTNDRIESAVTGNVFTEANLCIVRLDKLSRNEDIQEKLRVTDWDLIVVDEAHKMSATVWGGEIKYTKRFQLGRLLSSITRHFLLLTATPHNGKEEDFQLFMSLIDQDRFEGVARSGHQAVDVSDVMRRLVKEDLLKFDGTPLFPERRAYTVNYDLSPLESKLYTAVTDYVQEEFNRADQLNSDRKTTVGFALTILQRRLASSPEAIYQSLKRRRERLESRLAEERLGKRAAEYTVSVYDDYDDDDMPSAELEDTEERVVDQASAAQTISELEAEIATLKKLERMANDVRQSGEDRKWDELSKLLQDDDNMFGGDGMREKLIIFTEHRDTLRYLTDKIRSLLAKEFDLIFDSITDKTKLWLDAIPQTPQAWAKGIIGEMKANLLIPDEYDGLYEAYIEREDFYKLMLNMIGIKAREKNLDAYFDLGTYEEHVALDPLKGEVYVSDGMTYTNYYNYLTKSTDALYQAMQMGIINTDSVNESQAYMTRVEIAKALVSIGNELGMDISDYEVLAYNDIDKVADSDKPYIYIAASKGLLRGDGLNFKPYDYCTYQEAYVILNRLYKSL